MEGVVLSCALCGTEFVLCRRCWNGNRYCSKRCSSDARKLSRRQAQCKYALTEKGRTSQKRRQRRYRLKKSKKNETDQTTKEEQIPIKVPPGDGVCWCCGNSIGVLVTISHGMEPSPFYFSFRRRKNNGASGRYSN